MIGNAAFNTLSSGYTLMQRRLSQTGPSLASVPGQLRAGSRRIGKRKSEFASGWQAAQRRACSPSRQVELPRSQASSHISCEGDTQAERGTLRVLRGRLPRKGGTTILNLGYLALCSKWS